MSIRAIDMRAAVDIASNLGNMQQIHWRLKDNEKEYPEIRKRARCGISEGLVKLEFPNLTIAYISFYHLATPNHKAIPANLIPSGEQQDPFSTALRKLSQSPKLKSLTLSGVIDPSFFWPSSSSPSNNQTTWPSLEMLHVTFDITAPSGKWYFERPPVGWLYDPSAGDDSTPAWENAAMDSRLDSTSLTSDDHFDEFNPLKTFYFVRSAPDNDTLTPLLEAMAKAAAQMPQLQEISLSTYLEAKRMEWGVSYYAPGQASRVTLQGEADELLKRRLYWDVGAWRAEPNLRALWRKVHGDSGVEMVERFLSRSTRTARPRYIGL